jgi:hypothetical protein
MKSFTPARPILLRHLLPIALTLALTAGCGRPAARTPAALAPGRDIELVTAAPSPSGEDSRPPDTAALTNVTGIFHGQWKHGTNVQYDIIHPIGRPLVISVIHPKHGVADVRNTQLDGYTLRFDQFVIPSPETSPAESTQSPPATGQMWNVVLRIALNNPDNMLLEMNLAGTTNHVTRLMKRVVDVKDGPTLADPEAPFALP